MADNGRAISFTPASPMLLNPATGGVRNAAVSESHMNRLNYTKSDTFALCIVSLLLKGLFQNLLEETVKSTLYRSGAVQACLNELPNQC